MIGRKIYYELITGDIILIVPEKHNQNAVNTTKEQDFLMFDVLQARDPNQIGLIQLEYGEKRSEFEQSNSQKVEVNTGEILFHFPNFEPSPNKQIEQIQNDLGNVLLERAIDKAKIANLEATAGDLLLEVANLKLGGNA